MIKRSTERGGGRGSGSMQREKLVKAKRDCGGMRSKSELNDREECCSAEQKKIIKVHFIERKRMEKIKPKILSEMPLSCWISKMMKKKNKIADDFCFQQNKQLKIVGEGGSLHLMPHSFVDVVEAQQNVGLAHWIDITASYPFLSSFTPS